jgi:para-aminobenzoate synthetase component 1
VGSSIRWEKIDNFRAKDLLKLFAHFEQKSWSFLLDSCAQTQSQGRYDIIVSSPCITYEFARGTHKLSGDWVTQETQTDLPKPTQKFQDYALSSSCPYENLARLQDDFNALFALESLSNIDLPFIVGAVGAYAYDGNTSSDNIIDAKPSQYQLPDISVGFYHSSVVFDNHTNTLNIFSIHPHFIDDIRNKVNQTLLKTAETSDFRLKHAWRANVSEAEYVSQFGKIEDYLHAGDCYQVNYAQRFSAPYEGSEWSAYLRLREVNKAPFSAFVRLPRSTILSLSPERFLLVKERRVETKPIKGTRKRDTNPIADAALAKELLSAEKDRAENLMIVDLLRNDLSKYCQPHSVKVPVLFALESYPAVHHMVSTVTGELKPTANVYQLFKGAFPGGSITGAPKVRAMQIIQELEADKRAIYCGSIGYVGVRGDMDTNICIRTLLAEETIDSHTQQKSQTLYCWAGGGIVLDSKDSDEYLESLHKVAKILPILDTANTGEIV